MKQVSTLKLTQQRWIRRHIIPYLQATTRQIESPQTTNTKKWYSLKPNHNSYRQTSSNSYILYSLSQDHTISYLPVSFPSGTQEVIVRYRQSSTEAPIDEAELAGGDILYKLDQARRPKLKVEKLAFLILSLLSPSLCHNPKLRA